MKRIAALIVCLLAQAVCAGEQSDGEDILAKALREVGFQRSDLGYQPKGYWNRFPMDIPYKLPAFDDLFAEPLKLYDYSTVMANAAETYLDPTFADTSNVGLYKLVYHLGVDKRFGGFRDYSANLAASPAGDSPIVTAIEGIYALAGRETEYRTFGSRYGTFDATSDLRKKIDTLPNTVQIVIAELLVNLADAIRWRNLAFRNCDRQDLDEAAAIRNMAQTQVDGQLYYPVLDDIATTIDWASLYYAALKTAAAAEKAERALLPLAKLVPADFEVEIETPFGRVAIFSPVYSPDKVPPRFFSWIRSGGQEWMSYDATNTLCVIDFGRRSIWRGSPGVATPSNPISVLIDLGGDDYYGYEDSTYPPSTGVGLTGVGLVIDSKGDDHYNGTIYAQGAGLFGVGVLLDREGNDTYKASESAQGCGYFGIGLCLDGTGNDEYYLHGDGQGMGGVGGGVGVLASFSGDDKYTAEPYASVFNRGDYHSQNLINANNAQGCGAGRRGDGSDGHSWAGGLGALIDIQGNDEYYSGNSTLAFGYWFGTGILVDRSGNDHYKSCYFTQASGAHFCNAILIDEAGDDYHELFETAGAGLAFGWDFANAILIDKGGNDRYTAKMISYGMSQIRSTALFLDLGGNDEYLFAEGGQGFGAATWQKDFANPSSLTPYYSYAKSFGGFIDIGGTDSYYSIKGDTRTPHPLAKNNAMWLQPSKADSTYGANNFGVGIDSDSGTVPELYKWEE